MAKFITFQTSEGKPTLINLDRINQVEELDPEAQTHHVLSKITFDNGRTVNIRASFNDILIDAIP